MITPWQGFVKRWENCDKCLLHSTRDKIVLARGAIPCDILVIGESPGFGEDTIGRPFVGPSGRMLDAILHDAGADKFRLAFTNLICCLPLDPEAEGNRKTIEPPEYAIDACHPRLIQFMRLCNPRLIILAGTAAAKWAPDLEFENTPAIQIHHPSYILRLDISIRALEIQRTTIKIRDSLEELNDE